MCLYTNVLQHFSKGGEFKGGEFLGLRLASLDERADTLRNIAGDSDSVSDLVKGGLLLGLRLASLDERADTLRNIAGDSDSVSDLVKIGRASCRERVFLSV